MKRLLILLPFLFVGLSVFGQTDDQKKKIIFDWWANSGSVVYSEDAQEVFALFPDVLSATEKTMIAGFVDSQVLSGNWPNIAAWIWHGFTSEANSLINWKGGANATKILTPTHDPTYGFRCNGDNTINTNFDLTTSLLYTQNNALYGAFVKTKRTADATTAVLVSPSVGTNQFLQQTGSAVATRVNSGTAVTEAASEGFKDNTFYVAKRVDAVNGTLHVKTVGQSIVTTTGAATSAVLGTSRTFRYCVNAAATQKLDADVIAFVAGSASIDVGNLLENFEIFFLNEVSEWDSMNVDWFSMNVDWDF